MTYQNIISRLVLSAVLLIWASFFVAIALYRAEGSLLVFLQAEYNVPIWGTSLLCFGIAAIFAWAGLSAMFSKTWQDERHETVMITMSAALGVAIGFAGLTPQSEFWQFVAQIGVVLSLALTSVAAGLLLAVSTTPMPVIQQNVMPQKQRVGNNDNRLPYARRTESTAQEIATFQTLKDRWPR